MRPDVTHWTCNDCLLTIFVNQKKVMWSLTIEQLEAMKVFQPHLCDCLVDWLVDCLIIRMNWWIHWLIGRLVARLVDRETIARNIASHVQSTCTPLRPKNLFKPWENQNWESVKQHLNQCNVNESVKFPSVCPNPLFFQKQIFMTRTSRCFTWIWVHACCSLSDTMDSLADSALISRPFCLFPDSYLQTNSSKDFQRCVIDMLEDAEVVSTMLIPGVCLCVSVCLWERGRRAPTCTLNH